MKEIGFIGAYDKIDLVMYVGKTLTVLGKKVLIVDCTRVQKAKYIVPVISPTVKYITEFEDMDVAVGFSNFDEIRKYLSVAEDQEMEYDYILVDTDNSDGIEQFNLQNARNKLFYNFF